MNHIFKQQSLAEIAKYHKGLFFTCIALSVANILLVLKLYCAEERWVLIPTANTEKRLEVSTRGYGESFIKEWAMEVITILMTTDSENVERGIAKIRDVSSVNNALDEFFKTHSSFVKGSKISSVFFPKEVLFDDENQAAIVIGAFKYWFAESETPVSQDRAYRLSYKRGINGVLLLKEIVNLNQEELKKIKEKKQGNK
jgi:conjugal transfer pilus assembly protein TraE